MRVNTMPGADRLSHPRSLCRTRLSKPHVRSAASLALVYRSLRLPARSRGVERPSPASRNKPPSGASVSRADEVGQRRGDALEHRAKLADVSTSKAAHGDLSSSSLSEAGKRDSIASRTGASHARDLEAQVLRSLFYLVGEVRLSSSAHALVYSR